MMYDVTDYTVPELVLVVVSHSPEDVFVYRRSDGVCIGRVFFGQGSQYASDIRREWEQGNYKTVMDLFTAHPCSVTGHGADLMTVTNKYLAATPQLNVQYDAYDPTTVTFESADDGHGGWYVCCTQDTNTIYWWGGAFECDDLACYLNHGHFEDAYNLMFNQWGGITTHGEHLVKTLTTLIKKQQDDTDLLVDTDTWGIGNKPHAKVKQWEPDTPDPDVDLMKSIRDACAR